MIRRQKILILIIAFGIPSFYSISATTKVIHPKAQIDQNVNDPFMLKFLNDGGFDGNAFDVEISNTHIVYRENDPAGQEVKNIERPLTADELGDIRKIIEELDFVNLSSQDFTKEPLYPDQASYRVFLLLDGKENAVHCGVPSSRTGPVTRCQKQIDKLRLKINSVLDTNIY